MSMNNPGNNNKPVFLFSAGPRAGSTFVQRLITSGREVMMWGEGSGALNHILRSLALLRLTLSANPHNPLSGYGAEQFSNFIKGGTDCNQWIANINPPFHLIVHAYRNLFDNIYGAPARELGYTRWGMKEVRGERSTIDALHTLFPQAKFIFLVRNPVDCLRSIKRRGYRFADNWGNPLSGRPAHLHFADNWFQLAMQYHSIDFGFHIRYEDITRDKALVSRLGEYLEIAGLNFDSVATSRADWPELNNNDLTDEETRVITERARPAMERYASLCLWYKPLYL